MDIPTSVSNFHVLIFSKKLTDRLLWHVIFHILLKLERSFSNKKKNTIEIIITWEAYYS